MSSSNIGVKILFGTASFGSIPTETSEKFLELLQKHGIKDLDTANNYDGSELALGNLGAPRSFTIHTKAPGFAPGRLKRESVLEGAKKSLEKLQVESVETYFLHSPDSETPIEETMDAVQEVYKSGQFKRFGLSNFTPEDTKKIHEYAKSKGYVLPTVYQGNFNPVARHYETTLFPLLRHLKISFYAYSPIAGGFLVKDKETLMGGGTGRWDPNSFVGNMYHKRYNRPSLMEALTEWESLSKDTGISKAALAYRWVRYDSELSTEHGDGVIIGASSVRQLEETLSTIEDGPLDTNTVRRIDQVWETVKNEAPTDNYHE